MLKWLYGLLVLENIKSWFKMMLYVAVKLPFNPFEPGPNTCRNFGTKRTKLGTKNPLLQLPVCFLHIWRALKMRQIHKGKVVNSQNKEVEYNL